MNSARSKFAELPDVAFEIEAYVTVSTGEKTQNIDISYVGGLRQAYKTAHVTVTDPSGTWESREISVHSGLHTVTHILDPETGDWVMGQSESPYYLDLLKIDLLTVLGLREKALDQLALHGERSAGGMMMHVVSGNLRNIDLAGTSGDLDVLYLIGKDDELLRTVEVNGALHLNNQTNTTVAEQ